MNTKWIALILAAVLFLILPACDNRRKSRRLINGSWVTKSETRDVGDFKHIALSGAGGDLYVKIGNKSELQIEADDNILPYISTNVVNETLEVRQVAGVALHPRRRIKYFATVLELESIACNDWNSNGRIIVPDLTGDQFSFSAAASQYCSLGVLNVSKVLINPGAPGSIYGEFPQEIDIKAVFAKELTVHNHMNKDIYIGKGRVDHQEVRIKNAGSYKAPNLESTTADVEIIGEGDVEIRVAQTLNVNCVDFSGNLYYLGDPVITQNRKSENSGELIRIEE